jgi:hypothetical protein
MMPPLTIITASKVTAPRRADRAVATPVFGDQPFGRISRAFEIDD